MKITQIFVAVLLVFLSACDSSTDPDNSFPTDAKDFMFAGNPGTEIVFTHMSTTVDTNGIQTTSTIDTIIWTIMERNALHPKAGTALRVGEGYKSADSIVSIKDSSYYSFFDNGIGYFGSIRDTSPEMIFKNPLAVGAQWSNKEDLIFTIKSVGEDVNTPYKLLKAVRIEAQDSSTFNQEKHTKKYKYHFAPEVLLAKAENVTITTYPNSKIMTRTEAIELVRYSKK